MDQVNTPHFLWTSFSHHLNYWTMADLDQLLVFGYVPCLCLEYCGDDGDDSEVIDFLENGSLS